MKLNQTLIITLLSAVFCITGAVVRADEVVTAQKTFADVKVSAITEDTVTLGDGTTCSLGDVTVIRFSNVSLPKEQSGVYTADGTRLGGILYAQTGGNWILRSAPFGMLPLQLSKLAGAYWDSRSLPDRTQIAPGLVRGKGAPVSADVKLITGSCVQYVTPGGVFTEEAPDKAKLHAAFRCVLPAAPVLVRLTNGDELCGNVTFHGKTIHAEFNGLPLPEIPFGAISAIEIQHQPRKDEKQ